MKQLIYNCTWPLYINVGICVVFMGQKTDSTQQSG